MIYIYAVLILVAGLLVGMWLGFDHAARTAVRPPVEDGVCRHVSSEKLKVSQFGDKQPQYLCFKCGQKVSFSELTELN